MEPLGHRRGYGRVVKQQNRFTVSGPAAFFPFQVPLLFFLVSRPCIFRGGNLDLGRIPRAQSREANIAQQHREIISYCESRVKIFRMEVVHLEWLGLGPKHDLLRNRRLTSSLSLFPPVPSLSPLFLPGAVRQELPPRGFARCVSQRNVRAACRLPAQLSLCCDSEGLRWVFASSTAAAPGASPASAHAVGA